jgi:hypothetical protein
MDDARQGLAIISSRAQSLGRFMEACTRLAKLPGPKLRPVDVGPLVERIAALEQRQIIRLVPGPELRIQADEDHPSTARAPSVRWRDARLEPPEGVPQDAARGLRKKAPMT